MRRNNLDIQRIEVKEMTENARKVFDLLGVEPNEKFKIEDKNCFWKIDEKLNLYYRQGHYDNGDDAYNAFVYGSSLIIDLINNPERIIKLPKEPKKKKLMDLTAEEYEKWREKNCTITFKSCTKCPFKSVVCFPAANNLWLNHKEIYSDKFLNQEIEVK